MRSIFRPSLLLTLALAAVVGAAAVIFQMGPTPNGPTPQPVRPGDWEVVWLYPATNAGSWERFVAAVRRAAEHLRGDYADMQLHDGPLAFPAETTATPEVALSWSASGKRLVFRWYKLTSDWKTRDWIDALVQREPPPLAIIGGNNSDAAREVAHYLHAATKALPEAKRPLLLLTTATADRVPEIESDDTTFDRTALPQTALTDLYRGRTFRFCFTNQQMADAVTQLIWRHDDLRPDSDPVHVVRWHDDTYSSDLMGGFLAALQRLVTLEAVGDWMWATGCAAQQNIGGLGAGGFPVWRAGSNGSGFRMADLPTPQLIDSSVGTFLTPNRFEAQAARNLLDNALAHPQRRPLLVVTGQTVPSRRFLRALVRLAPEYSRRFVVATGDALAFNTVLRDRQVTWPIQDLPFPLVFFCHYNPTDASAGFRLGRDTMDAASDMSATGTEDVLLNSDIVEALSRAFANRGTGSPDATELASRLRESRLRDGRLGNDPSGQLLFSAHGNRRTGTGEHVVVLRPRFDGVRVLPQALLEVWARSTPAAAGPVWERRGAPLIVDYDDVAPEGGSSP